MAYKAHRDDMDIETNKDVEKARQAVKIAEQFGDPTVKTAAKISEGLGDLTNGKSYEIGNKLNKMMPGPANKMGQKALDKMSESGLGDKIEEAGNIKNAAESLGSPDGTKATPELEDKDSGLSKKPTSGLSDDDNDKNEEDNGYKLPKVKAGPILGAIGGLFAVVIPIILVIAVVFSTGDIVRDFFRGVGENVVAFFDNIKDKKNRKNEIKFYEELQKVQEEINRTEGVCIDANLIVAALTVDVDHMERIHEETADDKTSYESKVEKAEFEDDETDILPGDEDQTEYTRKMRKQIALLGGMQIKHNVYLHAKQGNPYLCDENREELITKENYSEADINFLGWLNGYTEESIISETIRDVANNDKETGVIGVFKNIGYVIGKIYVPYWVKDWAKEKNYAYYIYRPDGPHGLSANKEELRENEWRAYKENDGPLDFDKWYEDYLKKNGGKRGCDMKWVRDRTNEKNQLNKAELDIGDLKTMKDSVFYWNLVDQFIPDYYEEYLPKEGDPTREEKIERIAEEIYLLYTDMGPNRECKKISTTNCSYTVGGEDLSNVKVKLLDNDFNDLGEPLLDLEEYILGVVYAEDYPANGNKEAWKAQAVAARSYVLRRATKTTAADGTTVLAIRNSSNDQNYCNPKTSCYYYESEVPHVYHSSAKFGMTQWSGKPVLSEDKLSELTSALAEVTGEVLVDSNGNIIQAGYNSTIQKKWNSMTGSDYRTMLMSTYTDADNISSNCTSSGPDDGTGPGTRSGDITPSNCSTFDRNAKYWNEYGSGKKYKQCPWYAFGRAEQILVENLGYSIQEANNLLKKAFGGSPNGADWYAKGSQTGVFNFSKAINPKYDPKGFESQIRPGAIISWVGAPYYDGCDKNRGCGHVAIIESVSYDSSGNIKSITTSNGGSGSDGKGGICFLQTYTSLSSFWNSGGQKEYLDGFIYLSG